MGEKDGKNNLSVNLLAVILAPCCYFDDVGAVCCDGAWWSGEVGGNRRPRGYGEKMDGFLRNPNGYVDRNYGSGSIPGSEIHLQVRPAVRAIGIPVRFDERAFLFITILVVQSIKKPL